MNNEYTTSIAESTVNSSIHDDVHENTQSSDSIAEHFSSFLPHETDGQQPVEEINDQHAASPDVCDLTTVSHEFHHNQPNLRMDQQEPHTHRSDESAIVFSTLAHNELDESSPNNVPPSFEDVVSGCPPNLESHQANASQPSPEVSDHLANFLTRDIQTEEPFRIHPYILLPVWRIESILVVSDVNVQPTTTLSDGPSASAPLPTELSENFSNMHFYPASTQQPCKEVNDDHPNCDAQQNFFSVEQNWEQEMFSHSRSKSLQRDKNAGEFSLPLSLDGPVVQTSSNLDQKHVDRNQALQSSNLVNLEPIGTGEKPFGCEKKYVTQPPTKMKPPQCKICKKLFPSEWKWANHMRYAHGVKKLFECDICHHFFSSSFNLNVHKRSVHDKEKQFQCDRCPLSFSRQDRMIDHKKRAHDKVNTQPPTKMKPLQCKICKKLFPSKSKWVNHMRDAHGVEKPFECDHCDYSSSNSSHVKRHKRSVHDKEKPSFQCDRCPHSFSRQDKLVDHKRRVHDKVKPH